MVGWMRCMVDWHMDSCGGRERRGQSSRPAVTDWSSIDSIRCKTPNQTNRHSGRARDESGRGEGGGRERGKGGDVVGDSITFHYTCLRPPPWRPPSCTHTMSHRDVMHCRAASRAVCVCVRACVRVCVCVCVSAQPHALWFRFETIRPTFSKWNDGLLICPSVVTVDRMHYLWINYEWHVIYSNMLALASGESWQHFDNSLI